jgi:plasmid maintenance system antidote protein VapI
MKTTTELLDAVKTRYAIPSDNALAPRLGITRSMVSRYRNKGEAFGDETALRVAELLDLDPGYVLAVMHSERASNEAARTAWAKLAERLKTGGVAAALVLLVTAHGLSPTPAQAAPVHEFGSNVYYVK